MFEIKGKYTTAKVMIDEVEESCIAQIIQMVNHPAFTNPIAIMPDTHSGKGSVIGFTMPLGDKLIPNIIGVDIGCGMLSFPIGKTLPFSFEEMDKKIRKIVPFGMNVHIKSKVNIFSAKHLIKDMSRIAYEIFGSSLKEDYTDIEKMCKRIGMSYDRFLKSIGTVGGGNHFIEIGKDINDIYWITIHTGSRNFGKCVAEYWQKKAEMYCKSTSLKGDYIKEIKARYDKKDWADMIAKFKEDVISVPKGMEYLEGEDILGYLCDMMVAQYYAEANRNMIMMNIVEELGLDWVECASDHIETVHNFIDMNDMIIRKGSIASYEGKEMIIPFNMRDGILICEGKSNKDWNFSAPHGAGRVLSRSKAKEVISQDEADDMMVGIYSSCVPIDESPAAYKDAKLIEACIEDTAKIVNRIIPVMNMKSVE